MPNRNDDVRHCEYHGRYEIEFNPVRGLSSTVCPYCMDWVDELGLADAWAHTHEDEDFFACGMCGEELKLTPYFDMRCPECSTKHTLVVIDYTNGVPTFMWVPTMLAEVRG